MTYLELIHFDAIQDTVRLGDASRVATAERLVSSYVISGEMAARLTAVVFPHLQFDEPANAGALWVAGGHGTGKSHLLAFIAGLAEHAEFAGSVTNKNALMVDPAAQAGGRAGLDAVAGRFKVILAELGSTTDSLQEILMGQMEKYLASQGALPHPPLSSRPERRKPVFEAMMAAFQEKFPDHGLLFVVDDLSKYLLTRKQPKRVQDLRFLRRLGEACRTGRFRLIAGGREALAGNPQLSSAADGPSQLQGHFTELVLGSSDVRFVISERLLRKTPSQKDQVREYLARFAKVFGTMQERMDEFVAMFPVHPDCIGVLEKDVFAERRGVLRLLSDAVEKRLEDTVPEDRPGLIAYDSYWEVLGGNPSCLSVPEIVKVIEFSKALEEKLDKAFERPQDRDVARRIVRALALHRLTREDLYSPIGVTAAGLRDALCLYQPGMEDADAGPADALLAHVATILGGLHKIGGGQIVTLNAENDQYYLHFKKFKRFITPELVLHWVNAVPFLTLALTGAIMLTSRFFHFDRELFSWTVLIHKLCALLWVCAVPLTVLFRAKDHWAHIRPMLTWGPEDAVWMVQSIRSAYDKKATVPAADRFNTGQKINACLVIMYYFSFAATGILMHWKGSILFPWYIHTALFFSAMGSTGGHMFLAMVNPSTRIALAGIFHGWAPMKYIEHHHPLSLPKQARGHAHGHGHEEPISLKQLVGEILRSKVDLTLLAIAVILAGVGLFVFSQGRLAAAKSLFTKSFSDLVQPSALSTKHQIGPTAEACTKCHMVTGELPDERCERCHADIKERGTNLIGYHGTLKGECRSCHREHQSRAQSIVPLVKEKFDHKLARFALEGKHARLACDECHKKKRPPDSKSIYYIGLKYGACLDCHRDQHAGQFAAACDTCHSPSGWKGSDLKFAHNVNSKFTLLGKHATVECVKCHKPKTPWSPLGSATFKGSPTECSGCHKDPHRKPFSAACTTCHSPAGWQGKALTFEHNKDTKFPLVAKHAEAACNKCHVPSSPGEHLGLARFHGLSAACADCHKDPHKGQLGLNCTKCHAAPSSWKLNALSFSHSSDSAFALRGKHASVDCIKCHKPQTAGGALSSARFKGLGTTCEACHKVQHPQPYGSSCVTCHTPAAWPKKKPAFDHKVNTRFELAGKHLLAKCSACHSPSRMGTLAQAPGTEYTCYTCHKQNDPHKGTLGATCSKCHTPAGWKGKDLIFNHNTMASYPLKVYHRNVGCVKCHQNGYIKPLSASCDSCHPESGGP